MVEDVRKYVKELLDVDDNKVEIVDSGTLTAMAEGKIVMPCEDMRWEGVPVLFGEEGMEHHGGKWVIKADLIASAAYILGRGDELFDRCERDAHGRQIGKKSLLGRLGWTERPLVDEYARIIRRLIGTETNKSNFRIILTHDVDRLRCDKLSMKWLLPDVRLDKHWTFPWFREMSAPLRDAMNGACEEFIFVKASNGLAHAAEDEPTYDLRGRDFSVLKKWCEKEGVKIGLHGSYYSACKVNELRVEKTKLEESIGKKVTLQRNHYLRQFSPNELKVMESVGFEDDYTSGWADIVGFKLGTCRSVRRLDLSDMSIGVLRMHPTAIMDCTLTDNKYMDLGEKEAVEKTMEIAKTIQEFGGEFVLLWHNHIVGKGSAHRRIYRQVMKMLTRFVLDERCK